MNKRTKQAPEAEGGKAGRVRHWLGVLLAVLDDIMAVSLGGFLAVGSGLTPARAPRNKE